MLAEDATPPVQMPVVDAAPIDQMLAGNTTPQVRSRQENLKKGNNVTIPTL